ncbi:MAG: ATP-dependent DNA helicase RecG [Candidatus Saccharibacteria bacterium]|nr:ATP-dependent DNA helicase RecG [Candidatus Saccharibacteria bacterium]
MSLTDSVESLKGIGPKTAEILKKAGIRTVRDFFYNLPRRYDNYQAATTLAEIRPGKVVVRGVIEKLTMRRARRRNLSIVEGIIRDKTGAVRVVWFNQSYRMKQFQEGKEYVFSGTYELKNNRFQLTSPSAASLSDIDEKSGLSPVYVAHGSLKSHNFQKLVGLNRGEFAQIPDLLPSVKTGVRKEALFSSHFPESEKKIAEAHDYLAYEELFELILASRLNREENEKLKATPVEFQVKKIRELVSRLPFRLTNAQRRAAWEIFQDMEKNTPMNRLLQGDVGSGKTMVAALAAYEAFTAGEQVAILAPTAILASQHFEGIGALLAQFGVKTALLTGSTKQKNILKKQIASGEINVVVGTHALLTDDTDFQNLGLVVIDEQHRFGVEQRQKLALKSPKGLAPHLLAMTATPIPRSLQLTIFGDLDVSILDELPKGRQPIETQILPEIELSSSLYPRLRSEINAKRQVYWICKAIDDGARASDDGGAADVMSVKSRAKRLKEIFPKYKIGILHGKMKPAEKDAVMEEFASGAIDILVSTTVVEVGVDVPNATLIVIENAEGYGLAQLHQLRGRVGRGSYKSFCYLLTSGDQPPSRRLKELEHSTDGFHLAEVDLKLRGPGEIYGALQHGALDLRIASLTDTKIIQRARADVESFLKKGPDVLKYKELMDGISKYQQITTLN